VSGPKVKHAGRSSAPRSKSIKRLMDHAHRIRPNGLACHWESVQPGDILLRIAAREEADVTREEAERLLAESYGERYAEVEVYAAECIRYGKGGKRFNQGVGNGSENCDPGNSNLGDPSRSNDEVGGTPGDPGRKGGNGK